MQPAPRGSVGFYHLLTAVKLGCGEIESKEEVKPWW